MKPKTKTEQQKKEALRKRCVTLAKWIARARDGFKCRYCGLGEPERGTQGSHVYAEAHSKSMSADVDNIIALCAAHHMTGVWNRAVNWNWHGTPAEATDWFREKWPDLAETLKKRNQELKVCDMAFWENKLKELKELEKQYKQNL